MPTLVWWSSLAKRPLGAHPWRWWLVEHLGAQLRRGASRTGEDKGNKPGQPSALDLRWEPKRRSTPNNFGNLCCSTHRQAPTASLLRTAGTAHPVSTDQLLSDFSFPNAPVSGSP